MGTRCQGAEEALAGPGRAGGNLLGVAPGALTADVSVWEA